MTSKAQSQSLIVKQETELELPPKVNSSESLTHSSPPPPPAANTTTTTTTTVDLSVSKSSLDESESLFEESSEVSPHKNVIPTPKMSPVENITKSNEPEAEQTQFTESIPSPSLPLTPLKTDSGDVKDTLTTTTTTTTTNNPTSDECSGTTKLQRTKSLEKRIKVTLSPTQMRRRSLQFTSLQFEMGFDTTKASQQPSEIKMDTTSKGKQTIIQNTITFLDSYNMLLV